MRIKHQIVHSCQRLSIYIRMFRRLVLYMEQEADLRGLVRWATRKRLREVRKRYQLSLTGLQQKLNNISRKRPLMYQAAALYLSFKRQLFPPRYRKGYAKKYRRSR